MKGCKICHALTPELDSTGRCLGCAMAKAATDAKTTYGKFVAARGRCEPVATSEEIELPVLDINGGKTHICEWCGKAFPLRGTTARYCSKLCRDNAHRIMARNAARARKGQVGKRYCLICGKELPEDSCWTRKTCPGECNYIHRKNQKKAKNARYRERKEAETND